MLRSDLCPPNTALLWKEEDCRLLVAATPEAQPPGDDLTAGHAACTLDNGKPPALLFVSTLPYMYVWTGQKLCTIFCVNSLFMYFSDVTIVF